MSELYTLFQSCTGLSTDSRTVEEGNLFFALHGPKFNGNEYARDALAKGAAYAIVDDESLEGVPGMVIVEDTLLALQDLARHHRRQFQFPVIGITGSNGKTTTKELIAAVLGKRFQVHYTSGNLNNHIGVPLTLLAMPDQTEVAVIEMGANHQGEIALLSAITEPTHGLITNIGKAHLEGFGGLEGVKKGKSELYRFLADANGVAFVNRDEPFLTGLSAPVGKRVFYEFTHSPSLDSPFYELQLLREEPTLCVAFLDEDGKLFSAETQLSGRHNLGNLATAVSLGKYFKVPPELIAEAIEDYTPKDNRSQWVNWKSNEVFLDAYNANPTSMRLTLEWFVKRHDKHKTVVLGSMLELGEYADEEHRKVLDFLLEQDLDQIFLIGEGFENTIISPKADHVFYTSVEKLRQKWDQHPPADRLILLKGSRRFGLEKLIQEGA